MVNIRNLIESDYPAVQAIYQQGIDMGDATFQSKTPDWKSWNKTKLAACRLVAIDNSAVIGWAALSPVSGLCVFNGIAEVSLYISNKAQGKGVGHNLLSALISSSEEQGLWTLQSGIFPENKASLALHKKNGFREVGVREKMGAMQDGTWRDVLFLERRSKVAGT
ncbi:MAG: N-acetyltransferase [Gammaproteobacteria bacterium]|jgi:phosphinothricin acetyltransferase|nr:N-acetyltransferase [Gammaproteobacteria bacterium]MBT3724358.1 N-acetyltransferase [Gammaproteobacteria bacterium]MBT4077088.1 N-acetyltransferase [Gammaproteobacteria bacterium]MBT4194043.1 N-acetyltransferase [Gammaproteobacteria bacterium]MBT4452062.1 N-acetyltransferase [Gammaproteobacteria bacterium]